MFLKCLLFWNKVLYTAISRKVVGLSARDKLEKYCGWSRVHCFSKKFERMAGEAIDICLWVLKESNKSRFDSYSVRNSVLIISHITFRNCRVPIFSDNLSRHNCVHGRLRWKCDWFNRRWIAVSSCRTRALMERNDLVSPPITYLYFYGNDVTY